MIKEAVVAVEDQRFYEHRGVDFQGIGRALYQDILSGSAQQGASTITQQFVKNALAAQDSRTILQKFREAAIAYHLERSVVEGQDPHRVPERDLLRRGGDRHRGRGAHLLRHRSSRLRTGGIRRPVRLPAVAVGGGPARRHDLLAERLLAAGQPRGGDRAAQPGHAADDRGGLSDRGGVHEVRRPRGPWRGRHHPAAGELGCPLLHVLAAPAARRPLRRRRGVRRRPADHLDPRPRLPAPDRGDRPEPSRRDRADRLGRRTRQRHRRRAGDGRRARTSRRRRSTSPPTDTASPAPPSSRSP